MKASSECGLFTALVRALSHCFHEARWAKGAFVRCMKTYRTSEEKIQKSGSQRCTRGGSDGLGHPYCAEFDNLAISVPAMPRLIESTFCIETCLSTRFTIFWSFLLSRNGE